MGDAGLEMTVTGCEAFIPVEAPSGLRCGSARGIAVPVSLVLAEPVGLTEVDGEFVAARLAELPLFVSRAEQAVRQAVTVGPARFEVDDVDADPGGDEPEIAFFYGVEWMVRFAVTALPACVELGVAVHFDGVDVVEVDDLTETSTV